MSDIKSITQLDKLDIIYFLPKLETWLKEILKLKKIDFFTTNNEEELLNYLNKIIVTKRNIKRIEEAIKNNIGFWDRASNKIFIPLTLKDTSYALIIIYGVDKSVGPEETNRLLPILQKNIVLYLHNYKYKQIFCNSNKIPSYIDTILEYLKTKTTTKDYILCIQLNKYVKEVTSIFSSIADIIDQYKLNYKLIGTSDYIRWYTTYNTENINEVIKAISIEIYKIYKINLSISAIPLFENKNYISKDRFTTNLIDSNYIKDVLNINIINYESLYKLKQKFKCKNLINLLKLTNTTIKRKNYIIACCLLSQDISSNYQEISQSLDQKKYKFISNSDNKTFFILQRLEDKYLSLQDEIDNFAKILSKFIESKLIQNIGISFKGHEFITKKFLPFLAFMTMIHAYMLGKNQMAIYNDITFNVIGDQILSFGDIINTIKYFKLGLKINPNNANLYNSLGVCLAELEKINEAHKMFLQAVRLNPNDPMMQYNLAGSYILKKDIKNAIIALKKAHQLSPQDVNMSIKLASLLLKNSKPKEVIAILEPFINSNCNSIAIYRLLARAYIDQQKWKKAKELLKKALKIKPSDPETLAILALGYLECANDPATAVRFVKQVEKQIYFNENLKELIYKIKLRLESYKAYDILKIS